MDFSTRLCSTTPRRSVVGEIQDLGRLRSQSVSKTTIQWPVGSGPHSINVREGLCKSGRVPAQKTRSCRGRKLAGRRICLPSHWTRKGNTAGGCGQSLETRSRAMRINAIKISRDSILEQKGGDEDDDDNPELCPVECVREFKSREEFDDILWYAKEQNALVVVDFFRTACGSCRYIEKGFTKLCMAGDGDDDVTVIFLKHNVMDEYDEPSDFADDLRIKVVPMFQFYKDGKLVESFATREKTKILAAIYKHTGLDMEDKTKSQER